MTIPRYMAMVNHWQEWPPVNEVVAMVFRSPESGSKSGNTVKGQSVSTDEFIQALQTLERAQG